MDNKIIPIMFSVIPILVGVFGSLYFFCFPATKWIHKKCNETRKQINILQQQLRQFINFAPKNREIWTTSLSTEYYEIKNSQEEYKRDLKIFKKYIPMIATILYFAIAVVSIYISYLILK